MVLEIFAVGRKTCHKNSRQIISKPILNSERERQNLNICLKV